MKEKDEVRKSWVKLTKERGKGKYIKRKAEDLINEVSCHGSCKVHSASCKEVRVLAFRNWNRAIYL